MERPDVELTLNHALQIFYAEELEIIRRDIAERTLCAQLARIMQRSFPQHSVHTEYNRHGVEPKEVELPNENGILTRNRVNPDIVVHQVGHDRENVVVIEVKKSTNAVPDHADLAKLAHIKQQIAYQHAVFLRLPTGDGADRKNIRIEWV